MQMLELGIAERANNLYASAITIVEKPVSDDIRICSDIRDLNKVFVIDPYEMPRNDDILDQVAGAPFIFNLDLTQGLPSFSGSQIASSHGISYLFWPVSIYGPPIWTSDFIQYIYETYARDAQMCETFAQAYIDDIYVFFSTFMGWPYQALRYYFRTYSECMSHC